MRALKIVLFVLTLTFSINVSSQAVYVTKTGAKYHKGNCRYLKYSKKEMTLEKAKSRGYTKCLVCKPTANNSKKETTTSTSLTSDNKGSASRKKTTATQCTGKTKSGSRCKRKTKSANGRCYQH
ncbi:hypothetical protein Q4Q34_04495 [Flavivirga abyssicola]|uniref:hypothetical protein n=1 Tax=Flavivirga abyssicola TaxID=3063533 RepID=UPI0026E1064E|nr:hypothetical protein [Flavivirga sp. MEBiC07777]WVK14287.1 hypothetical protein Q4Q34_04495 [Flavivirga sp. MEBiC07777]